MNQCSVSFILSYYQVEGLLLKQCLESLFALSAQIDAEVILIDDGTPDSPVPTWLAEWDMATRIRYHYQENKGLGGARNTGMQMATKEYIQFVDPDDYLIAEAYGRVFTLLQEKQPDLLAFYFYKVYDRTVAATPEIRASILYEGSGTDFLLRNNLHAGACSYLFRRALAKGLSFPEHTYHEDEAFTPLLYLRVGRLTVTDIPAYAYFQRKESIMNSGSRDKLHKRFSDLLKIQQGLEQQSVLMEAEARTAMRRRIDQNYMAMLFKLMTDSPNGAFLSLYLKRMKKQKGYPLPVHAYTRKYFLFSLFTALPFVPALFRRLFVALYKKI